MGRIQTTSGRFKAGTHSSRHKTSWLPRIRVVGFTSFVDSEHGVAILYTFNYPFCSGSEVNASIIVHDDNRRLPRRSCIRGYFYKRTLSLSPGSMNREPRVRYVYYTAIDAVITSSNP